MNAQSDLSVLDTPAQINQHLKQILIQAQNFAIEHQLNYTGSLPPQAAWQLLQLENTVLVDVRTSEERKFVGYVAESIHIPWATGTAFNRNPRFIKMLENQVEKDQLILILCRSGQRSALAAEAAIAAGFQQVYNVLEGFEGELNDHNQRNQKNGWKSHQLPWQQD